MLCALALFTCTGCKGSGTYAAKVVTNEAFADDNVEGAVDTGITTITIGDSVYNVKWSKSVRYESSNDLYDAYEVIGKSDKSDYPGKIRLDPKTGEVIFFLNVEPFPAIENMDTLSDDELKAAVEQQLGDLADFSQYNVFEVKRPIYNNGYTDISLSWQVKRDILCNISIAVTISENGVINTFSKIDSCPDGTAESYIPKDERIKLLEAEICSHLGVKSIDGVNYEILSEMLIYYHSKNCISYSVKITDELGFPELVLFRVCES